MSQATYATISTIAQSLGISHVKESIASKLAQDINRNILKIVSDSLQMMRTTKSKRLKAIHVNLALESNHLQPLFGYNETDRFQLINAGCVDAMDLLTYQDQQISVESLQKYENRPYPLDTNNDIVWLAVQGHHINREEEPESESYEQNYTEKSDTKQYIHQMVQRQRLESDFTMSSKHFITYELKLYNQTSRQLLMSGEINDREKMLQYLKKEKCLETLVPYYIQFAETEMLNVKNFEKLYIAISVPTALCQNDEISVDIYMHQFITIALSLLVGPKILPNNLVEQYIIRDYAADLLKIIIEKNLINYPRLEPTITKQLITILLDLKKAPSQKYGALAALEMLGLETISNFVLEILPTLISDQSIVKAAHSKNAEQVTRLYDKAVTTAGICLHNDTYKSTSTGRNPLNPKSRTKYRQIMDTFGSDLLTYYIDESALLFI